MKALFFEGPHKLAFKTIGTPKIGAHDVLLKIKSVGICGTDLHIFNGGTDVQPNIIIGHEFSGEVAAVGKLVANVKKGDRVVAEHFITCGACYFCLRGKPNLCVQSRVIGMHLPGALQEYMAIPAKLVYKFPQSLSFEEAALIEPLTIALFAASQAGFLLEKKVAVIGQGPVGILLDQVLSAAGAHVIGIDVIESRLAFARKKKWVGATLNPKSKNFVRDMEKLAPLGVDTSFEAVGKQETAELCLDITRRDGNIYMLGVFEHPTKIDLMKLVRKELNLYGSWTCTFSFPTAIDMVTEKKIDLKSLITHRYSFNNAIKAFTEAHSYTGARMKTVINF